MTTTSSPTLIFAQMPALADLFRMFLAGKHLNRVADPSLWAELERQEPSYVALFAALGFDLRIDARGFAWFHSAEAGNGIGKISRQLALLFLVVFDTKANAGQSLQRFMDWRIDHQWLAEVHEQHRDVLDAEGISPDVLADLLGRASTLGFAVEEPAGWRLLPAVYRYLDHFESLAAATKTDDDADDASVEDDGDEAPQEEGRQ
jgi:hypothetical protein